MKWLFTADVHVHPHKKSSERLQDCLDALRWIFQTAEDKGVEHVIFCGDLFHDRYNIDVLTYQKTYEVFKEFTDRNDFIVWLLIGNHDMFLAKEWTISSVIPLEGIPSVRVVNKPCVENLGGVPLAFMPYTADPISTLKAIDGSSAKVLAGHCALDGADLNPYARTKSEVLVENDGDMVPVDKSVFKNWEQVFLGHYHASQSIGNVEYIGSPLQLNFGEAFQKKHVILYHPTADLKEYIVNDFSPVHYILKPDELGEYAVKGNFLKVELPEGMTGPDVVDLRKQSLEQLHVKTFETKAPKKTAKQEELTVENAREVLKNEEEIVVKYIEECERQGKLKELGLKKEKLLSMTRKVLEKKPETHDE